MTYFKDIQDYIKSLAAANKLTSHNPPARQTFFRMDLSEATATTRENGSSPYVEVLQITGGLIGEEDSPRRSDVLRLLFASKADSQANGLSDEIERAQNEAFELMMQFIARMLEDSDIACPPPVVRYIRIGSSSWSPVGPINQYEYGWELNIPIILNFPDYDQNDWTA